MSILDELEQVLRTAEIRDAATFPNQGAHHSFRLTLEGGLVALCKPAATAPQGDTAMVQREVAGYVVARDLGWDLVAPTVLRTVELPDLGDTEASVQMLWPGYQPEAPVEQFSDDDTWKAGVFDVIVRHQDRSHNWGAITEGGETRLRLVDHGYAFTDDRPFVSVFAERWRDQEVPAEPCSDVERLLDGLPECDLHELLSPPLLTALEIRARTIVETGKLQLP